MRIPGYRRYSALLSNLIVASLVISGFALVAAQPIITAATPRHAACVHSVWLLHPGSVLAGASHWRGCAHLPLQDITISSYSLRLTTGSGIVVEKFVLK